MTRPAESHPAAARALPLRPSAGRVAHHRRGWGRWRAATLCAVYLLMGLHIAHWKIAGRTLAPLELNEVMYTLELGIVTAGFLFMLTAVLATLVFGRFFCSWGCHILALEDLAAWLLARLRLRPAPLRARVLALVPPLVAAYMFLWPQAVRLARGEPLPPLRVLGDAEGWASFVTDNFWRNLPGPAVALATFLVCGFVIVWLLGTRSFCAYVCPYGAVFRLADRFAPGRIVATGDCLRCGRCTAACQSHVRVHEELARFGTVVNPACLKDLDCIAACPNAAIGYRFVRPPLLRSRFGLRRARLPYDLSAGEELLLAAVFLAALLSLRGLYDAIPFFLALGTGAILAWLAVLTWRLARGREVWLSRLPLRRAGRLTRAGRAYTACMAVAFVLLAHCALVRYHEFRGHRAFERLTQTGPAPGRAPDAALLQQARYHLGAARRWGLAAPARLCMRLAVLCEMAGDLPAAEALLRDLMRDQPGAPRVRLALARVLARQGRTAEAVPLLLAVTRAAPRSERDAQALAALRSAAHELLGHIALGAGRIDAAQAALEAAVRECPDNPAARRALAALLLELGRPEAAVAQLRAVVAREPHSAEAHYNLGVALTAAGRSAEAVGAYRRALEIDARDPQVHNNLGHQLAQLGDAAGAEHHLRRAIALRPDYAEPHFNLGRLLLETGRAGPAVAHLRRAAELDARFAPAVAELLGSQGPKR